MSDYPKAMSHPRHRPAVKSTDAYVGQPEFLPDIVVNSAEQEAEQRAKGYMLRGEAMEEQGEFREYPKMLVHPDHHDEVPPAIDAHMENGAIVRTTRPGLPEKFPHKIVNSRAEQEAAQQLGWRETGASDAEAYESRVAEAVPPNDYEFEEYPKWLGVDPTGKDVIAKNAEEERLYRARQPQKAKA